MKTPKEVYDDYMRTGALAGYEGFATALSAAGYDIVQRPALPHAPALIHGVDPMWIRGVERRAGEMLASQVKSARP
jgi:hypothetical protein